MYEPISPSAHLLVANDRRSMINILIAATGIAYFLFTVYFVATTRYIYYK